MQKGEGEMADRLVMDVRLSDDVFGKKTSKQVKSALKDAFYGFGVIDEVRLSQKDNHKLCSVFFSKAMQKLKEYRRFFSCVFVCSSGFFHLNPTFPQCIAGQ